MHLGLIAFRFGVGEQLEQILSEEGLATDENNAPDGRRKLVDDSLCLFCRHLHIVVHAHAEAAVEVAPARKLDGGDGFLDRDGFLHGAQKACFV